MNRLVLVIGGGSIATRHIRNLQALNGIEVIACTRNKEIKDEFKVDTYMTLRDALTRGPNIAVIANITSQHVPTAIEAAECGCDLFIEKPLSNSLQGVEQLVELARTKALITMIGCNLRFHPALRAIKQALDLGLIGNVLSAAIHCGSYLPEWRPNTDYRDCYSARLSTGGGVVLDLIHELDYAYWLFGPIEAVAALVGKRSALEIETEDVVDMLVRFRSGLVAQVHLDYVQRSPSRGCRIIGAEGTLVWENERGRLTLIKPSSEEDILWAKQPDYETNEMYRTEMKHFLRCVATRTRPLIPLEDGIQLLRVALAAKDSSLTNHLVLV